jgi:Squalene-hopene cyclase C-terminal domain
MRDRATAIIFRAVAISACVLTSSCAPSSGSSSNKPGEIMHHDLSPNSVVAPSAKQPIPAAEIAQAASDSFEKGIGWAITNQRANGNWGSLESARAREIYLDTLASHLAFQTATTAIVTWSLIEPARTNPKCRAALERGLTELSSRKPPGRASGKTFYSVWAHNYLIYLSAAVQADPTLTAFHATWKTIGETEIALVRREQGADGGWGYYDFNFTGENPSGNESTSFNTAAMILALRSAQEQGAVIPPGTIEDATRAISRMQLPSGAFAYGTYAELNPRADYNKISGSSGRLQSCNVALNAVGAGKVTAETLMRGVQHLRDTHQYIEIGRGRVMPHESFYRNSGYYYYFDHYYAACALAAVPPSAERAELVRWLTEVMVHDQNPDGSWFDYPLYGYGKAYATGLGLLTLEILRPLIDTAAAANTTDVK